MVAYFGTNFHEVKAKVNELTRLDIFDDKLFARYTSIYFIYHSRKINYHTIKIASNN